MMQTALQWAQPVITVVSLTFGGGILYGDVQDLKLSVARGERLGNQVEIMEVKLQRAEDAQSKTVFALEKLVESVNHLNRAVVKLETRLEHQK